MDTLSDNLRYNVCPLPIRSAERNGEVVEESEMATNVVNLDALIPREDFAIESRVVNPARLERVDIRHLEEGFFSARFASQIFSEKRRGGRRLKWWIWSGPSWTAN